MNKAGWNSWASRAYILVPASTGIKGNNINKAYLLLWFAGSLSNSVSYSTLSQSRMHFLFSSEILTYQSMDLSIKKSLLITSHNFLQGSSAMSFFRALGWFTLPYSESSSMCWLLISQQAFHRQWPWCLHLTCILPSPTPGPGPIRGPLMGIFQCQNEEIYSKIPPLYILSRM